MNPINFTPMRSLHDLQQYENVAALTPALHSLCSHFGRVEKLSVLTAIHEGAQQAICFLRLESLEKEQQLMQSLGVSRFGGEVVFVVDLKAHEVEGEFGESTSWMDFSGSTSHAVTSAYMQASHNASPTLNAHH